MLTYLFKATKNDGWIDISRMSRHSRPPEPKGPRSVKIFYLSFYCIGMNGHDAIAIATLAKRATVGPRKETAAMTPLRFSTTESYGCFLYYIIIVLFRNRSAPSLPWLIQLWP
jgi:hypothetical protein